MNKKLKELQKEAKAVTEATTKAKKSKWLKKEDGVIESEIVHKESKPVKKNTSTTPKKEEIEDKKEDKSIITNLKDIEPNTLPKEIEIFVTDICERMGSPFEAGVVNALVLLGGLIGNRVAMKPKQFDNWIEVPNLWGCVVGRPSMKKTPVMNEVFKSIDRVLIEDKEVYKEEHEEYLHAQSIYEAKAKAHSDAIKKLYKDAKAKGEEVTPPEPLEDEAPTKPNQKRYIVDDATIEALQNILLENQRGLICKVDELAGFIQTFEKVGREGDRAFWLEAWNGKSSKIIDRVGRGNILIPKLCLSLIGNTQPDIIKKYVYEAIKGGKGDGLLQRMQLTVFAKDREYPYIDRSPDIEARENFDEVVYSIIKGGFEDYAISDEYTKIRYFEFDNEARGTFEKWYKENEREAKEAFNSALEAHIAKYPKMLSGLCLIYHVVEVVAGREKSALVTLDTLQKAIKLTETFKTHAYHLYSTHDREENEREEIYDAIIAYIRTQEAPLSFRQITHNVKGKPNKATIIGAIKGVFRYGGSKILSEY